MAFTKEENEIIQRAILWGQPVEVYHRVKALVDRETEGLVVGPSGEDAWRDVCADMIRSGRDEDAWRLFLTSSKKAMDNICIRMRALEKTYEASRIVVPMVKGFPNDNTFFSSLHELAEISDSTFAVLSRMDNG